MVNKDLAKNAPVIGLTLDSEESGGYSNMPWYAIRKNYCEVISAAGGVPIPLTHEMQLVSAYMEMIDGILVTGGDFDVDPSMFGQQISSDRVLTKPGRTDFETAMMRGCLQANRPIYGICGGQQLLNVVLGGSLIQHIPDTIPNALPHEQPNPRTEAGHSVTITPGTQLAAIVGQPSIEVNSAHHQAVDQVGAKVIINATASDGVIEGIEYPDHPFCIGVQWHPEYVISPADQDITNAFVAACRP